MDVKYVFAVDPGKMTGVALFSWSKNAEPELLWTDELEFVNYTKIVQKTLSEYKPDIVCEKFTINVQTAKKSQAPFSLECIGALKVLMLANGYDHEKDLRYQLPANAMNMFPNEKLKKLEYWHRGGAGHALDAIRHGLLYLVMSGWMPTKLLQ